MRFLDPKYGFRDLSVKEIYTLQVTRKIASDDKQLSI